MKIEETKLQNNLSTVFVHSPNSTTATVQIWFRAGSSLENKSNEGIAHFLEHMFFKGTDKRPGSLIASEVEKTGGEINAFTSFDYTCYYINCPNTSLESSVDIILDMVSNPKFSLEDITPERDVVLEEYKRSLDNPSQYSFFEIQKNIFKNEYSHPILGNEKTISTFSQEQLIEFRNKFYNNQNAKLVIAGDLKNQENIIKRIEKYKLPDGLISKFPVFSTQKNSQIISHNKDVNRVMLHFVIPAPEFSDRRAAPEDLAINCLGYGETSELYKELVVNNPLCSSCSASTMFFSKGGMHSIRLTFPVENFQKVIRKFKQVVLSKRKSGFSNEEVQKIKNLYIASKIYEKETLDSFAMSLGHGYAQNGDINCDELFIERIKKTSVEEVNSSLMKLFEKPIHGSIQLPKNKKKEKFELDLKKICSDLMIKNAKKKLKIKNQYDFDHNLKIKKIKEGVTFIYRKNDRTPTFSLQFYLKGGLSNENSSNNGIHNILAHSITKGYKGLPYKKLKGELEFLAASMNGFSGKNAFGLCMHGLSDHFSPLSKHFFNTIVHPSFSAKFIKNDLLFSRRQLENQKVDPIKQCFKLASQTFFGNHPYSQNVLGEESSLKKINSKSISQYYKKMKATSPLVITYCGDKSYNEVLNILEPYFKKLKTTGKFKFKNKNPNYKNKNKFQFLDREQSHIFLGYKGYKTSQKQDIYLKMLTSFLSGQSSKLFVEIRDKKGLCYTVQPVHVSALEAGYWGIYIGTSNEKGKKAIKSIEQLIIDLRNNGISEKEFKEIKKITEGQTLLNLQTNDDYASIYSIPILHGLKAGQFYDDQEKIKKSSREEFNKFLKTFLGKPYSIFIVGKENYLS